jgi:hypothetical protein
LLLLEKARMEIYLPDLPINSYSDLLETFETEFTYAFGGCTILHGLDGRYLSQTGSIIPDRINLIYADLPLALTSNLEIITKYVGKLKQIAFEALEEEAILIVVTQVFHAV